MNYEQVASGSSFAANAEAPEVDGQVESNEGISKGSLLVKRKTHAVRNEVFPQKKVVRRGHRRSIGSGVESENGMAGKDEVPSIQVNNPLLRVVCPSKEYWKPRTLHGGEEGSKGPGSASSSPCPEKYKVSPAYTKNVASKGSRIDIKFLRASGNANIQFQGESLKMVKGIYEEPSDKDSEEDDNQPSIKASEESGALVRSKRGRAQALPSRFRDSVVEPLKRGAKPTKSMPQDAEGPDGTPVCLPPNPKKRNKSTGQEGASGTQPHKKSRKVQEESVCLEAFEVEVLVEEDDRKDSSPRLSEGAGDGDTLDTEVKGNSTTNSPDVHNLEDFDMGAIVWAKSGKRNDPVWPAKVIDPIREAPGLVRKLSAPNRLCVMFYGPSLSKGKDRVCLLLNSTIYSSCHGWNNVHGQYVLMLVSSILVVFV